jgi:hypothetical protein
VTRIHADRQDWQATGAGARRTLPPSTDATALWFDAGAVSVSAP